MGEQLPAGEPGEGAVRSLAWPLPCLSLRACSLNTWLPELAPLTCVRCPPSAWGTPAPPTSRLPMPLFLSSCRHLLWAHPWHRAASIGGPDGASAAQTRPFLWLQKPPGGSISSVPLSLNDNNSKWFTYIPDLSFALQPLTCCHVFSTQYMGPTIACMLFLILPFPSNSYLIHQSPIKFMTKIYL